MRILINYVVFFIFMMEMIIADNNDKYQQFYKDMFELHNKYRKKHNANSLILDMELSKAAMRLAKNFGTDVDRHLNMGTNVYFEDDITKLNANNVFFTWYNEMNLYTGTDDPVMRSKTSSFTQIVWKSTEIIGMALYPVGNYVTIVIAYLPHGNIPNEYKDNVEIILKSDSSSSSSSKKPKRK